MSASTTFQRVSIRHMLQVYVVHLGKSTKTVHPNSWGISPVYHMCWKMSTRHIQRSVCVFFKLSPRYASSQPLFEMPRVEVGVST